MAKDTADTVYVRNARGTVHSVSAAHYEALLESDGTLPKHWAKLSEAEARKAAPGLFGLDADGQPVPASPASTASRDEMAGLLRDLVAGLKTEAAK